MAQPVDAKVYYGYLFESDKKPTPVLDALLRAIGTYIIGFIGDKDTLSLTPSKLAAFYKAVGGNYDSLFVDVPDASISYIYQSIGCQHTLRPTSNDFAAPTIPALTIRGFVRWQSIEILLNPEEHVPYIQYAVRHFALKHPDTGESFPIDLPIEAFPLHTDPLIEKWHSTCAQRLKEDATPDEDDRPNSRPSLPPRPDIRYAHVRVPIGTQRDRQRGSDYFTARPVLRRQTAGTYSSKPYPARTHRTHLSPNDAELSESRGRRKSVPDHHYRKSAGLAPPRAPSSPVEQVRASQKSPGDHSRRHSFPRHHRPPSGSSSSSSSDSDTDPEVSDPPIHRVPSQQQSARTSPKDPGPVRFNVPSPVSPIPAPSVPLSNIHRGKSTPNFQQKPKLMNYSIPIDPSGKLSSPFLQGGHVPLSRTESRNESIRWRDLLSIPRGPKRRSSVDMDAKAEKFYPLPSSWEREKYRKDERDEFIRVRSGSHDSKSRSSDKERRDRAREFLDQEGRRDPRHYAGGTRRSDGREYDN